MPMSMINLRLSQKEAETIDKFHRIIGKEKYINIAIALHELDMEFKKKGDYYMKQTMAIDMIQILLDDVIMDNKKKNKLKKLLNLMEKEFEYLYKNSSEKVKKELREKTRTRDDKEIESIIDDTPSLF